MYSQLYHEYLLKQALKRLPVLARELSQLINIKRKGILLDVGGGGPVKSPWSFLVPDSISRIAFDPEENDIENDGIRKTYDICLSNQSENREFHIDKNPRASSLHQWNDEFLERFNRNYYQTLRTIKVKCQTGDDVLKDEHNIDFIDINAEGHDFHVLEGLVETLINKAIFVRVEYESFQVYKEKNTYGDIEKILADNGYEILNIEMLEYGYDNCKLDRIQVQRGVMLWGKLNAIISPDILFKRIIDEDEEKALDMVFNYVIASFIAGAPSYSLRLIDKLNMASYTNIPYQKIEELIFTCSRRDVKDAMIFPFIYLASPIVYFLKKITG